MMKKIITYLRSVCRQFIRYFITGLSAVTLDIGSLYILKSFIHPVTAVIINQFFILNYVFFVNKYWAFQSRGMTRGQIIRFYILALGNYLFAISWMWLFYSRLSIGYPLIIRTANVALAVGWNFVLYKYWVYNTDYADSIGQ